ncbi:hypothetical protein ASD62_03300 [Phycicoccus sp. Root563]|nr:hypothetical protein ASC58_20355 [Phycicoccus sp. Root101]KQZ88484.1 hypothetical protein ASD62_03300 [Phycicoccus sp. Root563]
MWSQEWDKLAFEDFCAGAIGDDGPADLRREPQDSVRRPFLGPPWSLIFEAVKLDPDPMRIGECPIKCGLTEAAHGALTSSVDRKPTV